MNRKKLDAFRMLCAEARSCRACPKLADKFAVLSEQNGSLEPSVFFIGEAPGRVGADRTRRPFYGDKSGANFQTLLDSIGLTRERIFITSAVMCSPRSATDANRRPSVSEIRNCSGFLSRLLELVDPPVVATLGAVALEALKDISYHDFRLHTHVGSSLKWNGRTLLPLYHPSPQVIASSRPLAEQIRDFAALEKLIQRIGDSVKGLSAGTL